MRLFRNLLKESGYAGYSKSNNAIDAEESGEMNASQLAKALSCSTVAIKKLLSPSSWHHTSKEYNKTNYYSEPLLLAIAGKGTIEKDEEGFLAKYKQQESYPTEEEITEAKSLLQQLRSYSKEQQEETHKNQHVEWLEWYGKHQAPTKNSADNVIVITKGSTAWVRLRDDRVMKKLISSKGFSFIPQQDYDDSKRRFADTLKKELQQRISFYEEKYGNKVLSIADEKLKSKENSTAYVAIKDDVVITGILSQNVRNLENTIAKLKQISNKIQYGRISNALFWPIKELNF